MTEARRIVPEPILRDDHRFEMARGTDCDDKEKKKKKKRRKAAPKKKKSPPKKR